MIRPRRSLLFMPGSNARALEKARKLPADGIILDLEDSVAPDAKAVARDQIAKAIAAGGFGKREVLIRVNSLDTPWWVDDVTMAGKARPDGILVPKVSTVADLNAIANRLSDINADMSIRVWAMIETARAVLDADKLAAASKDSETRLAGFVFGPNDISRETRIRMQPGRAAMIPMITHCILATRAHGLEILDGPYSDISNIDGFATECAQGRDLGFDGKTLIHPSHIEACNAIFTPPAEEVAEARKIIAAFEKPENASRGAIQLDGRMVERLHADMAKRTIAIADAIAAMGTAWDVGSLLPVTKGSQGRRTRRFDAHGDVELIPRCSQMDALSQPLRCPRALVVWCAIFFVMRGGGAGGEIAVALALVAAQRADALHVAQHERLGARQIVLVDAERRQHLRQFVGGMRPPTDQRLQIGGRHPQFAGDLAEIGGVHLAHFPQLAPVLQPFAEDVDHEADDGIGLFLNGHGTAPSVAGCPR